MRLIIGLIFFFLVSCATQKVEVIQQENCYQYKTFPEFHRCSEKVVKSSFDYKFSFERDIIDQYFAFGEVLALQVEKKTAPEYFEKYYPFENHFLDFLPFV